MLKRDVAREIVSSLSVSHPPDVRFLCLADRLSDGCEDVLEWLDDSGLALQFWSRALESGVAEQIPRALGTRLSRNLADHKQRVHAMLREFAFINACFASAGIPYAALKGFSLFPNYCHDIFLRPAYDFDYIVAEDAQECADLALRTGGYVRKQSRVKHPSVYFDPARPPRSPSSRDELYQPGFPGTIELRLNIWHPDELRIPLYLPVDFLAKQELRWLRVQGEFPDVGPMQFYALHNTDELVVQILHIFRHILHNWCRLSWLLDLAYFLETKPSDHDFWTRFFDRIVTVRHLTEIVGLVFSLTSETFGATIPWAVAERVVTPLPSPIRLWVKRYGHEAALSQFSRDKFALFLHREFIENAATWREVRRARLLPFHRPNHAARTPSRTYGDRLRGALTQGFYIAQRLKHHSRSLLRYGLEVPFWTHARSQSLRLER